MKKVLRENGSGLYQNGVWDIWIVARKSLVQLLGSIQRLALELSDICTYISQKVLVILLCAWPIWHWNTEVMCRSTTHTIGSNHIYGHRADYDWVTCLYLYWRNPVIGVCVSGAVYLYWRHSVMWGSASVTYLYGGNPIIGGLCQCGCKPLMKELSHNWRVCAGCDYTFIEET